MIGWLQGIICFRSKDSVILNVAGVGYEVLLSASTLDSIGQTGDDVSLFIHTHVREDGIILYGFAHAQDRELFLQLISVSGIGPKTAMGLLSAMPIDRLVDSIRTKNAGALQSAPGIGRKTAERLVVELQDRLKDFRLPSSSERSPIPSFGSLQDEVVSALMNLGYKKPMAESAVARVPLSNEDSFDKIFKESLRFLAK